MSSPNTPDAWSPSPYGDHASRWFRPIVLALLLVLLDELGVFSVLLLIILGLFHLPRTLLARKFANCRRERFIRLGIYAAGASTALTIAILNVGIAKDRAERIITAVEHYHSANGHYPASLEQLAPRFIAEIPLKARLSWSDRGYSYIAGANEHTLMYVVMPPFGRRLYRFESREWDEID